MYTIYLFAVIGLYIGLRKSEEGIWGLLLSELKYAYFGILSGAIVATVLGFAVRKHDIVYEPATLVPVRNSDGVSGTLILVPGSGGQQATYRFMMKFKDGSMSPGWVPANSLVHVIEDHSLSGIGYWRTIVREANPEQLLYHWAISYPEPLSHEFRVPAGTVVQCFEVK